MSLLLPVLGCALLFAVFGVMRRGREREAGCDTCTTECPAKELRHGDR